MAQQSSFLSADSLNQFYNLQMSSWWNVHYSRDLNNEVMVNVSFYHIYCGLMFT